MLIKKVLYRADFSSKCIHSVIYLCKALIRRRFLS
jgi:hypothetical protein